MKTRSIKGDEIKEKWYIVDAKGVRLGKVAARVAALLIGKHDVLKNTYLNLKNKVVVINSETVDIHPRKIIGKIYYSHSGYPGGLKEVEYGRMHKQRPNRVIELAVKGMLPKNKLQDRRMANLYIYQTEDHKHDAQQPEKVTI